MRILRITEGYLTQLINSLAISTEDKELLLAVIHKHAGSKVRFFTEIFAWHLSGYDTFMFNDNDSQSRFNTVTRALADIGITPTPSRLVIVDAYHILYGMSSTDNALSYKFKSVLFDDLFECLIEIVGDEGASVASSNLFSALDTAVTAIESTLLYTQGTGDIGPTPYDLLLYLHEKENSTLFIIL